MLVVAVKGAVGSQSSIDLQSSMEDDRSAKIQEPEPQSRKRASDRSFLWFVSVFTALECPRGNTRLWTHSSEHMNVAERISADVSAISVVADNHEVQLRYQRTDLKAVV